MTWLTGTSRGAEEAMDRVAYRLTGPVARRNRAIQVLLGLREPRRGLNGPDFQALNRYARALRLLARESARKGTT